MWAPITVSPLKSMSTSSRSSGCWQAERTRRAGDADVDGHGETELGARGVDGVVELVVERVLLHQRRDPHQHDGGILGQGTQPRDLLHRPLGAIDRQRDTQAVRVGGHRVEQRAGLLRRDAGRQHADVDPALVHGDEHVLQRGGGREITPQELGDAFVPGLAHEGGGRLAAQRVDPQVDDRHAGSVARGAGVPSEPAAFAAALAFALRR